MIIEFVKDELTQDRPMVLLHYKVGYDRPKQVEHVINQLKDKLKTHNVIVVPDGQPCPINPLPKITVARESNTELVSAYMKMCKEQGPHSIVLLNDNEMDAIKMAQKDGDLIYL